MLVRVIASAGAGVLLSGLGAAAARAAKAVARRAKDRIARDVSKAGGS